MQQTTLTAMGQMVSAISHHWRQPLTAVSFILQNIKNAFRLGKLDNDYLEECISNGMEQIQSMSKTIDDLMYFQRATQTDATFDVGQAISEVISILSATFQSNNIHCHFLNEMSPPVKTVGFVNEFKQVLTNILHNAVLAVNKKTEKGLLEQGNGEIRLILNQRGKKVFIQIHNNGESIPGSVMPRMFDPFYTTRKEGRGLGVGLYLSKIIIENNMWGRIHARNTRTGAVFVIQLNAEV